MVFKAGTTSYEFPPFEIKWSFAVSFNSNIVSIQSTGNETGTISNDFVPDLASFVRVVFKSGPIHGVLPNLDWNAIV